jgi:hypothetical protein
MAYKKRRSTALEKAQNRLNGLQSLYPAIDLGNGLSLQGFAALIEASSEQLQAHNVALSEADRTRIEFAEIEVAVSTMASRILSAIAATYGRGSKEYEMAGGKPPSSYRRSTKPVVATDSIDSQLNTDASSIPTSNGAVMNGAEGMAKSGL